MLGRHIPIADVARALLGVPDATRSTEARLVYGDIAIDIARNRFWDMEAEVGGDAVQLVNRVTGLENGGAEDWITQNVDAPELPPELPEGLDAERQLIGIMLLDPKSRHLTEEEVMPADFVEPLHAELFKVFQDSWENNYEIGIKSVIGALGLDPKMPVFDGWTLGQYVARLAARADRSLDVRSLAREVRQIAEIERGDLDPDQEAVPEPFVTKYGAVPWERIDDPAPEHSYVIDGWLSAGDKSIIGGPSKSGKSFLAIHAALAIALPAAGIAFDFFDAKILAPGLVVYQAGEGARGIRKRLRAFRQHFKIPHDLRVPFVLLQSRVDVYHPKGDTDGLIKEIEGVRSQYLGVPLRAVFIDTLATATGGADENSGKDMSQVMTNIDRIGTHFQTHVCLVHHLNAAGTKLRGHTSIFANLDQAVFTTLDEETRVRTALLDKQKDDEDGLRIRFELQSVKLGERKDGKAVTSCVCVRVGDRELVQRQAASAGYSLKSSEEVVFRAVLMAVKKRGWAAAEEQIKAGVPDTAMVTSYETWMECYQSVAAPGKGGVAQTEDAIRKLFTRLVPPMVKANVIGWSRPWLWWTGRPVRGFEETAPKPVEGWTKFGRLADIGYDTDD